MNADKYRQLNEVHLLHRIWQNELELALQEVNFWEELLGTLSEGLDPSVTDSASWKAEISQLHHFQRLSKRLLDNIKTIDSEVAAGVKTGHGLDTESRLDHQYLRTEMDSFHSDFRTFKSIIRQYMIDQPTF
jgi:hypothetical protein